MDGEVMRHTPDWGRTPTGKRYAVCSCGFRAPARARLTHGLSDIRDHFAAVKREAKEQGWHPVIVGSGIAFSREPQEPVVTFQRRPTAIEPMSRRARRRSWDESSRRPSDVPQGDTPDSEEIRESAPPMAFGPLFSDARDEFERGAS